MPLGQRLVVDTFGDDQAFLVSYSHAATFQLVSWKLRFPPCLRSNYYTQHVELCCAGSIALTKIDALMDVKVHDPSKNSALIKDVISMFYELRCEDPRGKIPLKRINQVQVYKKLKKTQEVCNAVHKIRKQLKLRGKFELLDKALVSHVVYGWNHLIKCV